MRNPINDLEHLKRLIQDLPPPTPGYKRVFRGQTNNFPEMLSSTCRPDATTKGFLWKLALTKIKEIHEHHQNSTESAMNYIMNFSTWFEALIQHYGPGSPYLDITSSIEVALWFALNEVKITMQDFWNFEMGHPRIPMQFPTLYFYPKVHGSSWFYVLDVPLWNGESLPKHGELVDLSEGPVFVTSCSRVQRQEGGLVYGDKETNGGDLSCFYACDPIEISRPFSGTTLIDENYAYFFPPPNKDEWFERLLKAPLVPHIDKNNGFRYKQSLEVYIITDSPELQQDLSLLEIQTERMSMLVRGVMRTHPKTLQEVCSTYKVSPEDATYFQIDVPLLSTLNPVDKWNQPVLRYGLGKRTQPVLLDEDIKLPGVTLENVMIEFSPFERAFFSHNQENEPLSALWLTIDENNYRCTFFFKRKNTFSFTSGTLEIIYSVENGRFEIKQKDNFISLIQSGMPETLIKGFFVSLYVLRSLSSALKPDPFFNMIFGDIGMLPVRDNSITLVRARKDPMDMRLHFLLNSGSNTQYGGPTLDLPAITTLYIEPAKQFPSLKSLQEVYGHVVKIGNMVNETDFPVRKSAGFDPEIADYVMRIFSHFQ